MKNKEDLNNFEEIKEDNRCKKGIFAFLINMVKRKSRAKPVKRRYVVVGGRIKKRKRKSWF